MYNDKAINIYELVGRYEIRKMEGRQQYKDHGKTNPKTMGRLQELEEMIRSINNGRLINLTED